jgi:hypothetical protein
MTRDLLEVHARIRVLDVVAQARRARRRALRSGHHLQRAFHHARDGALDVVNPIVREAHDARGAGNHGGREALVGGEPRARLLTHGERREVLVHGATTHARRRHAHLHDEVEAPQERGVDVVDVVRGPQRRHRVLLERADQKALVLAPLHHAEHRREGAARQHVLDLVEDDHAALGARQEALAEHVRAEARGAHLVGRHGALGVDVAGHGHLLEGRHERRQLLRALVDLRRVPRAQAELVDDVLVEPEAVSSRRAAGHAHDLPRRAREPEARERVEDAE